ncbi:DUF397 domain-containing protein [Streptomyces sp. PSKA54]|uniref:DUF397 domain-containing protein n=1 Tax=Streptomyces himalayensis subsp. aureolus TaxID=2758039 RepID=A0A7W2HEH2_9ACTN|nr:DUF397 domain-containing protein [Streptomyces himalayensis]MBA4860938.1 DUF397 domain-containing protein [Streptomyces himalayensis subsp. aureolus]
MRPELAWIKSSFSEDQANCVYVAAAPDGTLHLRESDTPDVVLHTTPAGLAALLHHLRPGSPGAK